MLKNARTHQPNTEIYKKDTFKRHIKLLKFLGVNVAYSDSPHRKRVVSDYSLSITIFLILSLSCASQIMALVKIDGTTSAKCVDVIFLTINLSTALKLLLVDLNSGKLAKLLTELRTEGDTESSPILRKIKTITDSYLVITFAILAIFVASPWLSGSRKLPITFWFPFQTDNIFCFLLAYFFACADFALITYTMEGVDTLLLLIAGLICRRLISIQNALVTIGAEEPLLKKGWKRFKAKGNSMGLSISRLASLSRDETLLRECIREHVNVIKLVRTFDIVLDDLFLIQVLVSTIVSTMSFYTVYKMDDPLKKSQIVFPMIAGTFIQFFMYCWIGESISDHSDDLHRSLYLSRWYNCREKIMKSMIIVTTFTKNHFKLEGGHVFKIDFRTFNMVLQESFSLFMVLRVIIR